MAYHYLWLEIEMLLHIVASWLASALALWIVAQIVPGIQVRGLGAALRLMLVPGRVGTSYL